MNHHRRVYNQNRKPAMPLPTLPKRRHLVGRYPLRLLENDQEFTTLLTKRLGYIIDKCISANRVVCMLDKDREVGLHADVIVEAH